MKSKILLGKVSSIAIIRRQYHGHGQIGADFNENHIDLCQEDVHVHEEVEPHIDVGINMFYFHGGF